MEILQTQDRNDKSQVASWYAGKNIFITGATGFMGKVLVEKLLRSCPDVKNIYLLIRSKRGQMAEIRKEQYLKCVIFNKILENNPDIIKKIRLIKGDILEDNLGMSEDDRKYLIDNTDVIFHCAANVRFDQPLRPMIQMNVLGTLKILDLAAKMLNLKVFVHVSTSYCQCNESVLEERAYAAPQNPYEIIEMIKTMDDKALAEITPQLLNGLPNTYAYSKALTEDLISRYEIKLPIIITRPSIVTAALKEPLPGWIEGVNGPTGLMIGAARGVIRSMHCNPDYTSTVIPVDKAINGMIVAGYHRAQQETKTVEFCNLCINSKALYTWGECIETGKRLFYETPLSFALWYPDGSIKKNYYHHMFCVIFFHYLPAYFIDFLLLLFGRKRFLVRVQNKISTGLELLQYYTTKEWEFKCEKFQQLHTLLNPIDQEIFDTDTSQVNWEAYIRVYIMGMRTYILGESESTIPQAKKVLQRLYLLDRLVTFVFYGLIFLYLWTHLDDFMESSDMLIQKTLQTIYTYSKNKTIEL
ncbi:putative fatty acyl-CoA reductase CG5065 isoform 1-T2 [Cochliomyia hominivorax]